MILLELKVADHRIIQLCLQKSRFNSGLSCQINFFFLIFMQSTFKLTWWIRGSRSRILCRNCVVTFQPRNPSYYKMIKTAVILKLLYFQNIQTSKHGSFLCVLVKVQFLSVMLRIHHCDCTAYKAEHPPHTKNNWMRLKKQNNQSVNLWKLHGSRNPKNKN